MLCSRVSGSSVERGDAPQGTFLCCKALRKVEANMSASGTRTRQAAPEKAALIGAIVEVMKSRWDLPADCNDGELFTYAEVLFDRIQAGEDRDALDRYISEVQTGKLGMPASSAHREIVDRSIAVLQELG
jgi:hypothetical protein